MIYYEDKYFRRIKFSQSQIKKYLEASARDLKIARQAKIPEVIFKFSYDALIKLGIALIARQGYKIRSIAGHHVKILEKMSQILKYSDIESIGNQMRQNRNFDFYDGGFLISIKDSQEYLEFIEKVFKKVF